MDLSTDDRVGRQQGVLVEWNDERGFGFIRPSSGGSQVFAHVSAFPRGRRPVSGSEVTYVEVRDERNRARASEVRYRAGVPATRARSSQVRYRSAVPASRARAEGVTSALAAVTLFFALLVVLVALERVPALVLAGYGLLSAVAFVMYGADKSAAVRGEWRTPESALHAIDLVGGWPGGLVARRAFRHKTTKQPFRTVFWFTAITNCLALAWFVLVAPVA